MTFVESGVNLDLRASLASEASQALQRHRYLSVYSTLGKSWSEKAKGGEYSRGEAPPFLPRCLARSREIRRPGWNR